MLLREIIYLTDLDNSKLNFIEGNKSVFHEESCENLSFYPDPDNVLNNTLK